MSEPKYVNGLYPKPKSANAPDFVIGKLSINLEQFMPWLREWCKENPGAEWINIDMTRQKNNPEKGSAKLDEWKPEQQASQPPAQEPPPADNFEDSIPF